jgi:hypothetical protein
VGRVGGGDALTFDDEDSRLELACFDVDPAVGTQDGVGMEWAPGIT